MLLIHLQIEQFPAQNPLMASSHLNLLLTDNANSSRCRQNYNMNENVSYVCFLAEMVFIGSDDDDDDDDDDS